MAVAYGTFGKALIIGAGYGTAFTQLGKLAGLRMYGLYHAVAYPSRRAIIA